MVVADWNIRRTNNPLSLAAMRFDTRWWSAHLCQKSELADSDDKKSDHYRE